MLRRVPALPAAVLAAALAAGCGPSEGPGSEGSEPRGSAMQPAAAGDEGGAGSEAQRSAAPVPEKGLLLGLSPFEVTEEGEVLPKPQAARTVVLVPRAEGEWEARTFEDPESNVFHKVMVYDPPQRGPGILTFAGSKAAVKLWRDGSPKTLWEEDFGGKFSRMRDAELADLYGDGTLDIAVATHDQGVVAVLRPGRDGEWRVEELDRQADTFVHEIEIGDLDGDGTSEVYATPSEPNRLDGTPQPGKVVRYVPAAGGEREVVAELGSRHAKEILVEDIDGDGTDELYVSVEAETEGKGADLRIIRPVEIRRYDAGSDPSGGARIATLEDRLCRFLTAGDVEGDGRKEMVAAAFRSGLWLLRPGGDPRAEWSVERIDRSSSGFEHAALLADLDEDGADELYVAADDQGEVRRYVWTGGGFEKQVIYTWPVPGAAFTWNLMPVPPELIPPRGRW